MINPAKGDVVGGTVTTEDPVGFFGKERSKAVDLGQKRIVAQFGQRLFELIAILTR